MIELTVCIGTSCHLRGSEKVVQVFKNRIKSNGLEDKVNLTGTFCMGKCSGESVVVSINSKIFELSPETAESFFMNEVASTIE